MNTEAVTYYRQHRRTVEALIASGWFTKRRPSPNVNLDIFLKNNRELHEIEKRTEAFNLFVALGVAEAEIRHSRLLAWLLNPLGSHGARTKYLKLFLELVCEEDGDELADHGLELKDFEVQVESDQMDIQLVHQAGHFVCVVENKVRIDQGDQQLETYRRRIEATHKDWTCKFVFLTLKGEQPADPAYIPIPYERVLHAVIGKQTKEVFGDADEARAVLFENYAEILRNNGKGLSPSNLMEILHLTRHELKHSHFLAWLLDPSGSHNLKDAFTRFMLSLLEQKGLKLPEPAATLNLSDAVVRTEREDIDILVVSERHRLVLAIENKFAAAESTCQLAKYHEFLQQHYAGDHFVQVFLDMQGRNPSHKSYWPVSYRELLPFFESELTRKSTTGNAERRVQIYVQHYAALLTDQLWIKRKTKWYLPARIQECCERLAQRHADDTSSLIHEVTSWQKTLARGLEHFLYEVADRCFGKSFRFTWDIWFTFIPPALDEIPILSEGGADPALPGRMVMYQFFVVPFGDAATVRNPGIFLDVKLVAARRGYENIKQQLHDAALTHNSLFNRVKNSARLAKFDILLNHEICSFEEAVTCDETELRHRISNRVERFSKSIHPKIVAFFKKQFADVKPALSQSGRTIQRASNEH